jgi:hypothetical protein
MANFGHKPREGEITPALRVLLLAVRSACFMIGDAISDYLGLRRRGS